MAHIKFPPDFARQRTLLADIIDKNTELGDDSPITAFLTEKEIDLKADNQAGIDAQTQEDNRAKNEAISIAAYKNRDTAFATVLKFVKQAAQLLKRFYAPNYSSLLDWAIPITDSGRIDYPASFEESSDMCNKFILKLNSFPPDKSPLQPFLVTNKIDLVKMLSLVTDSIKNNTLGKVSSKLAENATEQRNLLWKNPNDHIHLIGDFLKTIFPNNPRALGEWGFVVDESTTKPTLRKSRLMLAEIRTVTGVVLGSILTNTGKVVINVYRGNATTGELTILKPGDKMGILKGYSTITIQNTSTLEIAEYEIEVKR